jgi:hypothetical protein
VNRFCALSASSGALRRQDNPRAFGASFFVKGEYRTN